MPIEVVGNPGVRTNVRYHTVTIAYSADRYSSEPDAVIEILADAWGDFGDDEIMLLGWSTSDSADPMETIWDPDLLAVRNALISARNNRRDQSTISQPQDGTMSIDELNRSLDEMLAAERTGVPGVPGVPEQPEQPTESTRPRPIWQYAWTQVEATEDNDDGPGDDGFEITYDATPQPRRAGASSIGIQFWPNLQVPFSERTWTRDLSRFPRPQLVQHIREWQNLSAGHTGFRFPLSGLNVNLDSSGTSGRGFVSAIVREVQIYHEVETRAARTREAVSETPRGMTYQVATPTVSTDSTVNTVSWQQYTNGTNRSTL